MDFLADIIDFFSHETLADYILAAVIIAVTAIVARIASKGLNHLLNRDESTLPSVSIIVNIVRVVIWLIGLSVLLDLCFGVNANALITALGVGGVALSLGLQDTLSNLIGGLQVTFMHIIAPGDNIEVGGDSGVVDDITWRHTTIVDSLGQRIVIPNSVISKNALVHLLPENRVTVPISVPRPFALPTDGDTNTPETSTLDSIANALVITTKQAVEPVSPVTSGPSVFFSEVADRSVTGKIIFQVEDANKTFAAADATVRAVAKLLS